MRSCRSALVVLLALTVPAAAQDDAPDPCQAPALHQFDFWLGTWDVSWEGGHGTNTIERLLDGCVVRESFEGDGLRGTSLTTWDAAGGQWLQTWVDNAGATMHFTGGMVGDNMVLGRTVQRPDGGELRQRMVFREISDDSLIWDWESSKDGGSTWDLRWRIEYKRK